MKAMVQDKYGSSDILELRDVQKLQPADDEVLIRVHAAGLDPGVWHLMTGLPYLVRWPLRLALAGLARQLPQRLYPLGRWRSLTWLLSP